MVHIGDSTSDGLISPDYLPDPRQRIAAQYARVGVTTFIPEISDARSIVETYEGYPNGGRHEAQPGRHQGAGRTGGLMRTATTIEGSAGKETAEFAVEAEKLGLDVCRVAEAWGASAYFTHLDAGLARAGRRRADLDICQGAEINLVDEADLARTLAGRKKELAFSLGGMGSATSNFYNDAYSRQGWAEVAARVRERWQAGDRDGAAGLVTDEMVLATTLIGTEDMVRARLRTWRDVGVDTVRLYPAGDTLAARLDNLGRGIDLVRAAGTFIIPNGPTACPGQVHRPGPGRYPPARR